jgi:hypothetical protein
VHGGLCGSRADKAGKGSAEFDCRRFRFEIAISQGELNGQEVSCHGPLKKAKGTEHGDQNQPSLAMIEAPTLLHGYGKVASTKARGLRQCMRSTFFHPQTIASSTTNADSPEHESETGERIEWKKPKTCITANGPHH